MRDSSPTYTCGHCGQHWRARPIRCTCGRRCDREPLIATRARGGAIQVDVLSVGAPAFEPCASCRASGATGANPAALCDACGARYVELLTAPR